MVNGYCNLTSSPPVASGAVEAETKWEGVAVGAATLVRNFSSASQRFRPVERSRSTAGGNGGGPAGRGAEGVLHEEAAVQLRGWVLEDPRRHGRRRRGWRASGAGGVPGWGAKTEGRAGSCDGKEGEDHEEERADLQGVQEASWVLIDTLRSKLYL
ncbi:hypothetical protein OsJ_04278 [Oryza sativa Japonica Group]|uniref:Uncharacterized protein n=1 Tax=Oryza sativa subsp. japonica TaxID=39947 RepID=A3A061_ORYSJ|nr:hypothetical protein OsJ_04278 [Oryza sativa Japonica Group]